MVDIEEVLDFSNPTTFLLTLVLWGVCMLVLWKMQAFGTFQKTAKIGISVLSLPMIFFVVNWQLNKD